jgi:UDPglucose--hexose-1-phosphate uridylyltransferase
VKFNATGPHRRFNPLTGEWLLVSPHRAQRPWQGQIEKTISEDHPTYDADCYLCPGNARAGGNRNPTYTSTFVFDNDFPALLPTLPEAVDPVVTDHPLFQLENERGVCRVVCFSPQHDLTLAKMDVSDVAAVVDVWAQQTQELAEFSWLHYVQIFENRGQMMGASNPHPHGQIWATEHLPVEVVKEDDQQRTFYDTQATTLLTEVLRVEQESGERSLYANDHFTVLVPFWAVWPFETLVIANRPVQWVHELTAAERRGLAEALSALTIRYDNLFEIDFPYSMGIHQAPVNQGPQPHWHLHLHFYPPLLRSATIRKFMVGYEMLGTPQRDITPESAAKRLRELPAVRFSEHN